MLGEGVACSRCVASRTRSATGNRIYAVLRGLGSSSDGRAKSVYAPRPAGPGDGAAPRLRRRGLFAGRPSSLVEAHGTGTEAGDAAEFAALRDVFTEAAPSSTQWCALGSVKSQIGHTKAAAGAASLVKAVLALHTAGPAADHQGAAAEPGAAARRASPFYLNTGRRPWVRDHADHPRRAAVSSFGFGGSNFHVTLEEYTGRGDGASPGRLVGAAAAVLGQQPGDAAGGDRRAAGTPRHGHAARRRSRARATPASPTTRPFAPRSWFPSSPSWAPSAPRPRNC